MVYSKAIIKFLNYMSKRKINQQQAKRIQALQTRKRNHVQSSAIELDDELLGPAQAGLLITRYGKQLEVEAENGELYQCHSRQNLFDLVVGDKVIWQAGQNYTGVIVACSPRQTLLARASYRQTVKPIAANVEQILLVIAPEPIPTTLLLDSYLVAAAYTGIPLIIAVNKVDMLKQQSPALLKLLEDYQALGYRVILTSTLTDAGLTELKTILADKTSVLVGQSGVGKSSLIAKLLPETAVTIGKLAGNTKLGAHTTSAARLYHLPSGGNIIDSPGIREFALGPLSLEQIVSGFIEFRPFLGKCRFANCKHLQEPSCALQMAVDNRQISSQDRKSVV